MEVQNEIGQWGVICDDGWDDGDAFVLCSCLGYQEYVVSFAFLINVENEIKNIRSP